MQEKLLYIWDSDNNSYYPIPYITENDYSVKRNKLWGSDAGRNTFTGTFTGTLVGVFPTITAKVGKSKLTETDVSKLQKLLDKATVTAKYWDTKYQKYMKSKFYTNDSEVTIRSASKNVRFAEISIELTPIEKFDYDEWKVD